MVDLTFLHNHRVVIFGTGILAAKCVYSLLNRQIQVEYFLNNNCKIQTFCNRPVFSPDENNIKDVFIIVAASENALLSIGKQLRDNGLKEFSDFIYYPLIDKKMVLLHGNCHMSVIKEYLESNETFSKEYCIYYNPLICHNTEHRIREEVLRNCDVLVHEDIQEDNYCGYYLSDKYIRQQLKNDVKDITMPHLFGLGKMLFPQVEYSKDNPPISNGENGNGLFPHADIIIDKCIKRGMSIEDIVLFVKSDEAIGKEYIHKNFTEYMKKIKEREKCWDIKIYDFIMEHYKNEKLFFDIGHPTNIIMGEIAKHILEKLDIFDFDIAAKSQMDAFETPVYPIVKKTLGLLWEDNKLRKSGYGRMTDVMDLEEYVREYIWWCYGGDVNGINIHSLCE